MNISDVLKWQWNGYTKHHKSRINLWIHIFAVPVFIFGGEKNRLLFGMLMMQDINVLIMDEPTNHMDIEAIDALNNALKEFEGTLIFVSHDREFVSSLANRIIDIKDQQLIDFQGTLDEYFDNQQVLAKKTA